MSPRTGAALRFPVLVASILLFAAACSAPATGSTTVTDAWVRAGTGMDKPTAAYLTITNTTTKPDALLSVSAPIAGTVQIHRTMTDASGMTGMQPVDRVNVPAGGTVRLEPGGFHLMLMGLTQVPAVGSSVELRLVFEQAGTIVVQAAVRQA